MVSIKTQNTAVVCVTQRVEGEKENELVAGPLERPKPGLALASVPACNFINYTATHSPSLSLAARMY
jgi:hypothetical protein